MFTISKPKNKFTSVGCKTCAIIMAEHDGRYQIFIPTGLKNLNVSVTSFNNHKNVWDFNPCSYAFVADKSSVSAIKVLMSW
ncbi:hypothetical protein Goklo_007375 [Gossypium klotzschianum]|uniref:Uncharacterized protein n=1 Tax=Gossypium klotzschianum TaxID=34286 RepID=A0A7J8W9Y4_9ROSI|nr:hypothetical protein [Gossypium klotzschianum]